MKKEIIDAARLLWDYHLMHQKLKSADCILALGSHDLRVAGRAADLYLQGFAPFLVMSGGLGNLTKDMWTESEAEKFAAVAIDKGVPEKDILIESSSTNTGENILFTKKLLFENNLECNRMILVQKPYMERRTFATVKKLWPEPEVMITSPELSFEDYPTDEIPLQRVINIMVGDLQRIIVYPSKGFQIPQEVPSNVQEAFEFLKCNGFDKHLIK